MNTIRSLTLGWNVESLGIQYVYLAHILGIVVFCQCFDAELIVCGKLVEIRAVLRSVRSVILRSDLS